MNIYVGNLSYDITEDELRQAFAAFGAVTSVSIPQDRYSGRPRGFAFVEMAEKSAGEAAIAGLNSKALRDRTIVVSEARPKTDDRGGRSGGGGDRRGGGGGGYGGGGGGYGGGGGRSGGGGGGRGRY
jgi:RNA recognition motif-containing protein